MTPQPDTELTADDISHLKYLMWGHYILGGLTVICGFFPFIHLAVGIGMVSGRLDGHPEPMGFFFMAVACTMIACFWATAGLTMYAGRCLRDQRNRTLCFIVAIVQCVLFQPLGLVLGILTIVVLIRPSVRDAFARNQAREQVSSVAPTSF